ncbi:EscU/YscU/HrcU family type III secretion system export apparatus switch protein [Corallococcus praedator]|uniref:EscU/YscU/HrcU family type III secretion system export apparatus switch protein n=1 Tax=Corallococcus praedator TaxID=2316724 RepID=A0ABX9QMH1_9BACT|nr:MULTISPECIES: EscU/YscU/HrcU family type III secretion system export apparatus switch protein [Corallococcus]RKH34263.1 EscU/YscU/HrcU family type III secretion system export apparatus switch protein [Corallococcus sp. CA031C]RKI12388.1 EscU/YscU/HrcU family type III secretion system export apparatus switch protein [Corallococcus praedator]
MSGEKTEQPTARRLREARRKGQFPRSRMLSSSAVTLGGLLGFIAFAPEGFARLKDWASRLFLEQTLPGAWEEGAWVAVRLCGPALGGALVASLAVSVATVGFEMDARHAAPKLERINPAAGLKRLFSTRPLLEMGKALLVAALLALWGWSEVETVGPDALRAAWLDGTRGMDFLVGRLAALVVQLAWVVLGCGAVDYALARRRHLRDLMMTRDEVRREHKESEGDPRHKGQRKALHRQLAQGGPARGVQKATAVIVNPTHIAVALRYEAGECDAPYLVAKGREDDALALKEEARRQGIPVVRDVPLARSLIHFDVGESIPEELYQAAAVVLRTAMETRETDDRPRRQT